MFLKLYLTKYVIFVQRKLVNVHRLALRLHIYLIKWTHIKCLPLIKNYEIFGWSRSRRGLDKGGRCQFWELAHRGELSPDTVIQYNMFTHPQEVHTPQNWTKKRSAPRPSSKWNAQQRKELFTFAFCVQSQSNRFPLFFRLSECRLEAGWPDEFVKKSLKV
jgi:hypothetical protein